MYLTEDQIVLLRSIAQRRGISMAELIRRAVDAFTRRDASIDPDEALERTFGASPGLEVPSRAEWDRDRA